MKIITIDILLGNKKKIECTYALYITLYLPIIAMLY